MPDKSPITRPEGFVLPMLILVGNKSLRPDKKHSRQDKTDNRYVILKTQ